MKFDIIAEIGQAHEGSLGIAHSYIDAVSKTGVNAVKFQTHIAEAESSAHENFRVNFSYEDKTRYDYWKRMEFSEEQWIGLKKHCDELNLEFLSSPFSLKAVELLEKIGVKRYKIGSGEVTNHLLIEAICKTGKPIILSSGMSNYKEIDEAVSLIEKFNVNCSILQCTTSYPTNPKNWGLNIIKDLKNRYPNIKIGFSDHSGDIYACLFAAAHGAEIFEFHVVFDKQIFGPDSSSSLSISDVSKLVAGLKQYELSKLSRISKNNNEKYFELKQIFEKSLTVNRDLSIGDEIKFEFLDAKKPKNMGIDAIEFKSVLGKKLKKNIKKWSFLNYDDII